MKFDVMLTGIGGEGVLTTGVIIARAAQIQGYSLRGVQLHGLSQRGGNIPTFVRFGTKNEVSSPTTMQANADLIIAFEPLEALRAIYYARKNKTSFVINDYPYIPIYSNLLKIPYPNLDEILERVKTFAKNAHVFDVHKIAEKEFGDIIFGNTILVGISVGLGLLPLKEKNLYESIKYSLPKGLENNLKAFELGLKIGKKGNIDE